LLSSSSSSSPEAAQTGQELAPVILPAFCRTGCYGVIGPDPSAVLDKFNLFQTTFHFPIMSSNFQKAADLILAHRFMNMRCIWRAQAWWRFCLAHQAASMGWASRTGLSQRRQAAAGPKKGMRTSFVIF
jgi:hypothetical protein